jgi:predicted short-subunit dehydrogenase-like oxidoreductase (DUF2520 family)
MKGPAGIREDQDGSTLNYYYYLRIIYGTVLVVGVKSDINIGIVGAGVMGTALSMGLSAAGCNLSAITSRTKWSALRLIRRIPESRYFSSAEEFSQTCDLIFITTPDDLIYDVAATFPWKAGQSVIHCSGVRGLSVLDSASAQGALVGAFHPFQIFANVTSREEALERFSDIHVAIEAKGRLLKVLQGMAKKFDGKTLRVDNKHRALYHSSAVLSCGYLVTLLYSAVQLWRQIGLSEEQALDAIGAMAHSTVQSVRRYGFASTVTVPVVRGDITTLNRHFRALTINDTGLLKLFIALTEASLPMVGEFLSEDKQKEILKLVMRYNMPSKNKNMFRRYDSG